MPIVELYDLEIDPKELDNLYDLERDRATELARLLPEESARVQSQAALGEEERRALESLGYLASSSEEPQKASYGLRRRPQAAHGLYERKMQRFHRPLSGRRAGGGGSDRARRIIAEQPRLAHAHFYLAQALLDQGKAQEALQAMQRARSAGVSNQALERQLGLTLTEVGEPQRGLEILAALDDQIPENLDAYGLALAEAGQLDRATEVLNRSLSLETGNARALENLALVELRRERWEQCEQRARQALAVDPELPLAWNYLGIALFRTGRTSDALSAWQRSVELDPQDLDVIFNLATTALNAQETTIARRALEQFIAAAPPERYAADIAQARKLIASLDP